MTTNYVTALALAVFSPAVIDVVQQPDPVAEEMDRWRLEHKAHMNRLLEIYFEQIRTREPLTLTISDDLLGRHPSDSLELLAPYEQDASPSVRRFAYSFASRTGVLSDSPEIREGVVSRLVKGCGDPEGGVWQWAAKCLLSFEEPDFSPEARDTLREIVTKGHVRQEVVRVVGVAGMTEMLPWLEKISDRSWYAVLARARLGDDQAAAEVVERVGTVDKPAYRLGSYLDDLAYTHHPLALGYMARSLAGYLDSSELWPRKLPANPKRRDIQQKPERQRAVFLLAKYFADCPVEKRPGPAYTDAEIDRAKEWVKERYGQHKE